MSEIQITHVDKGRFFKPDKAWEAARAIIQDFLIEADVPAATYKLRAHKHVRWMGNPVRPLKVSRYDEHGIVITVKPPGCGNDSSWEYLLVGDFPEWDAKSIFHHLRRAIDADGPTGPAEPDPDFFEESAPVPVAPAPVAPVKKMTLAEKIAALEITASRNKPREQRLSQLAAEIEQRRQEIVAIQSKIDQLEAEQISVMEAIEGDAECHEAQRSIAALEGLLA